MHSARPCRSSVSQTEFCPKLSASTTGPEISHDSFYDETLPVESHYTVSSGSVETTSYKPASHLVPSPNTTISPPQEPISYHVPTPTPSPRERPVSSQKEQQTPVKPVRRGKSHEEQGQAPSPIAPVRRGKTGLSTTHEHVQSASSIAPVRAQGDSMRSQNSTTILYPRSSASIKEEWLQAYAGAAAPPGIAIVARPNTVFH